MDSAKNFTDEDKKKVIDFINMVAKNATFNMDTSEIIEYFKLLSFMQKNLLPKIDNNILEIKQVVNSQDESSDES